MEAIGGFASAYGFLVLIKPILEIFVYMSIIAVSFKALRALNIYINKNL
ncbi:MAG TPA: hypothetical protein VEB00_08235 [Clostridia bacterium]|nr:hypothetical protein [Clostridia bacterium]